MMARRIIVVGAVAAAAALAIGGVALADGFDDVDDDRPTAVSAPRIPAALPVPAAAPAAPSITPEQAAATAVAHLGGGGQVREIELEREHGHLEWEVDVVDDGVRHDVHVDATSGTVTRQDTPDDGTDDGADD
ncbi:PepSY domain-containing protein [Actinomycetes bacterium KLBMP 9759]